MPVLTEMDPSGSREQIPKKSEKKNNLITNFFKSPPSSKGNKLAGIKASEEEPLDVSDTQDKQCKVENRRGTEAENDLNNSLCDFETTTQINPIRLPKQKTKEEKKDKGRSKARKTKKNRNSEISSRENKDDSIELPCEDFSSLNLDGEESDVNISKSKEEIQSKERGKGENVETVGHISVSKEISYEDFLKSSSLERSDDSNDHTENQNGEESKLEDGCEDNVEKEPTDTQELKEVEEPSDTEDSKENINDESVVIIDENVDMLRENKSPEKKKIGSYFTILPSRQLMQTEGGPKAPVVITVNVPDSPVTKPSKSFSIFDKPKAKNSNQKLDHTTEKHPKTNPLEEDKDELNEDLTQKRKCKKRLKVGTQQGKVSRSKKVGRAEDNENDDIIVETVQNESEHQRKLVANKMACLDQVVVKSTKKAMQSTLSFGQDGLTAMKSPPSSTTEVNEKAKETGTVTKGKPKLKTTRESRKKPNSSKEVVDSPVKPVRSQRTKKSQVLQSDSDDFEIEVLATPKQRKARKRTDTEKSSEMLDSEEESKPRRRRRSKRIYSAEIVESPVSVKKAPIKLRLTRVSSSNSDKEGSKSLKVSKAQQLLQKAKTGKKKTTSSPIKKTKDKIAKVKKTKKGTVEKQPEDEDKCTSNLRRSSRSCSRAATEAITECVEVSDKKVRKRIEESDEEMTTKKIKKPPAVKTPSKTPSKPKKKGKIAPIFLKKNDVPITIDSDGETHPEKTIDPEKLKAQRNFLLSGVPEQLKKSRPVVASLYGDYPPIPEVNHVQQFSESELSWLKLSAPDIKFGFKEMSPFITNCNSQLPVGLMTNRNETNQSRAFQKKDPAKFDESQDDRVRYLLGEISLYNSQYPVRRMYKQFKAKRDQSDQSKTEKPENKRNCGEEENKQVNSTKETSIRKSRKRKLEDEMNNLPEGKKSCRRTKRRKGEDGETEDCHLFDEQVNETAKENCNILDAKKKPQEDNESVTSDVDILWTEKYQPTCAADILGNTKQVKKVWTWLKEWKDRTDMEIKRLKKQLMKEARRGKITKEEAKKKLGGDVWGDDDSDFDLNDYSSDSDGSEYEDDDGLCNTMVLSGPHGVGKTATVNALATELGYKVFEVNASSKRNGKHILAQLQEATQSHQVCKENLDAMYTTFESLSKNSSEKSEAKVEKKMPTSFANFFKKNNQSNSKGSEPEVKKSQKETPKKKAKKQEVNTNVKNGKPNGIPLKGSRKEMIQAQSTAVDSPSKRKGLNLSSTSLILFEEVDVVFEEDKGFWAAIQTFISTTKRPIILTTCDASVTDIAESRYELITLKRPTPENIASHLQTVCLTEKIRTDYYDLLSVVNFCGGDLRKSMNAVQFWTNSGGGVVKEERPIQYYAKFMKKTEEPTLAISTSQPPPPPVLTPVKHRSIIEQLNSSIDSEDEFISIPRPRRKRRAPMIMSDDESSRDSFMGSPIRSRPGLATVSEEAEDSQGSQESMSAEVSEVDKKDVLTASDVVAPAVHLGCLDSVVLCKVHSNMLLDTLKDVGRDTSRVAHLSSHLKVLGKDAVYNHLLYLLHLPRVTEKPNSTLFNAGPSELNFGWKAKTLRRIKRPESDLFDSDCSSDEEKIKSNEVDESDSKHSSRNAGDKRRREMDPGAELMIGSLTALSEMCDAFSYSDAYLSNKSEIKEGKCSRHTQQKWSPGRLTSGMSDEKSRYDEKRNHYDNDISLELNCSILNRTNTKLRNYLGDLSQQPAESLEDIKQRLTIPVPKENLDCVMARDESSLLTSLRNRRVRVVGYVADCLPAHVQCQHTAITQDYLPSIRLICKSEQLRQATNTKRRFLHYFDAASFGVTRKQSVMDVLCSSFL